MKPDLKTQLQDIKLSPSDYGRLPIREDAMLIEPKEIMKRVEKLNLIRKNLRIIDKYINGNKGESLMEWLVAHKDNGAIRDFQQILGVIGQYNNDTGGISAYFFNLQHFYDEEEQKYDDAEAKSSMPADVKKEITPLRDERISKRKDRRVVRKKKLSEMKINGDGYIEVPEPPPLAADASGNQPEVESTLETSDNKNPTPEQAKANLNAAIEKAKSNTGFIWVSIAGVTFAIAVIWALNSDKK